MKSLNQIRFSLAIIGLLSCIVYAQGVVTETAFSDSGYGNEIRVTVPGRYKIVVCDGKSLSGNLNGNMPGMPRQSNPTNVDVSGFYDLQLHPDEQYNYASICGGFFSNRPNVTPRRDALFDDNGNFLNDTLGSFYPCGGTAELLEANPIRAVILYKYPAVNYGCLTPTAQINPDIEMEQKLVVYAPNRVYQTLTLVGIGDSVRLIDFDFMLHTSHARFSGGTTLSDGKWSIPGPWTFEHDTTTSYHNHDKIFHKAIPGFVRHENGDTSYHEMNFLLASHRESGCYTHVGNQYVGYRSAIALEDNQLLVDGTRLSFPSVLIGDPDMDSLADALYYADQYQNAPVLVPVGNVVVDNPWFDPSMGCFKLSAQNTDLELSFMGKYNWPVFEIHDWAGGEPAFVNINGTGKIPGVDYLAHVDKDVLLLQIRGDLEIADHIFIKSKGTDVSRTSAARSRVGAIRFVTRNTFDGQTLFSYSLPESGPARISIWNSCGQLVRQFGGSPMDAGTHHFFWDRKDVKGRPLGAGSYFVRLTAGSESRNGRLVLGQ